MAGLILAAGSGTRMGEPSKLLLPLEGRPLVRWSALAAREGGLDPVIVVVGHRAREVSRALRGLEVRAVTNRAWRAGQGASLAAGLRALEGAPDVVAVAVLLADEPGVEPAVIRRAVEAWRRSERPVVRSMYRDRPGHPVVLARSTFAALRRLASDEGALSGGGPHGPDVEPLRIDRRAPRDVDEPGDYRALVERGLRPADPGRT